MEYLYEYLVNNDYKESYNSDNNSIIDTRDKTYYIGKNKWLTINLTADSIKQYEDIFYIIFTNKLFIIISVKSPDEELFMYNNFPSQDEIDVLFFNINIIYDKLCTDKITNILSYDTAGNYPKLSKLVDLDDKNYNFVRIEHLLSIKVIPIYIPYDKILHFNKKSIKKSAYK